MSKTYRKKLPVEIFEAEQFTEEMALACLVDRKPGPFGLSVSGNCHPAKREIYSAWISSNREGSMRADIGDWIIREENGVIHSCKPDIFEATYEVVSDAEIERNA